MTSGLYRSNRSVIVSMEGTVTLRTGERKDLQRHTDTRNGRAGQARPFRLMRLRSEGLSWEKICAQFNCGNRCIARRSHRIAPDRLAEVFARSAGARATQ